MLAATCFSHQNPPNVYFRQAVNRIWTADHVSARYTSQSPPSFKVRNQICDDPRVPNLVLKRTKACQSLNDDDPALRTKFFDLLTPLHPLHAPSMLERSKFF